MELINDCRSVRSKIPSAIDYVDKAESDLKLAKSYIENGVIIDGLGYAIDSIDDYILYFSSLRNALSDLDSQCATIISAEQKRIADAVNSSNAGRDVRNLHFNNNRGINHTMY